MLQPELLFASRVMANSSMRVKALASDACTRMALTLPKLFLSFLLAKVLIDRIATVHSFTTINS